MPDLTFVTGNTQKFEIAFTQFKSNRLNLTQSTIHIDEIQADNSEEVVRKKVQDAFDALKAPVVVNDDSWSFEGLNGFPGPYMKDVSHWLTAQDFINLTHTLTDRKVVLSQWIAYQDESTQKLFSMKYQGEVLPEARGTYGNSLQKVITMPGDNGLSVAEVYDSGTDLGMREVGEGWQQFINWYKEYTK